ncbi:MAG: ABC transporter ATP-binding protein [Bdellovibrionales bacterium]|nr:ABC transporter ATP-binding protein [Bdellovibrionales bacterium]
MAKVLEVTDLRKSFKKGFIPTTVEVLKGVSFSVEPGTITGFLGANGAGKTTTMKCLLGLIYPTDGKMVYFGNRELDSQVKKRIGFLPEHPYFYEYLTGMEFLLFYGGISTSLKRSVLKDRIHDLLKRVDLFHAKDRQLRAYSKGMLQKIGLAQALIHDPEFVILDEPMSGLDPDGRYYLREIIKDTAKRGTAVFFSSHLLNDAETLCQNLVILKNGAVAYEGTTHNLLNKLGIEFEIRYYDQEKLVTEKIERDKANQRLGELIGQKKEIVSFRETVQSLEEAFIDLALKGVK